MKYNDVIKADKINEYIGYHIKFFRELADINTDVFYLEKIFNFPFKQFQLYFEEVFFSPICRNILHNLTIKIHRLLNDQTSGAFNLLQFKNNIMKDYLKDEFKSKLAIDLKTTDINEKSYEDILNRVKEARHEFVAHKNLKYFKKDDSDDNEYIFFHFNEIQNLVTGINDFFKVLSFDVADRYQKDDYYNLDVRQMIVDSYDDIIDNSMLTLIMNSDYVNTDYTWNSNLCELNTNDFNDEEKKLLESFKKKASNLKIE